MSQQTTTPQPPMTVTWLIPEVVVVDDHIDCRPMFATWLTPELVVVDELIDWEPLDAVTN